MRADASFAVPVKLWALLCVFAGVTIGGNVLLTCILTGGALLYLVLQRNFRLAASYGCFYLLLALLLYGIRFHGLRMPVFSEFYVLMFWNLSPIFLVSWDLITTPPGMLSAFLSRLRMPTPFILGLLVAFRFFPTMRTELKGVGRSMKNRGLTAAGQLVAHPVQSMEYVLVPFLLRVLQLADQLSVSAVARGAERPGVRGSYYEKRAGTRITSRQPHVRWSRLPIWFWKGAWHDRADTRFFSIRKLRYPDRWGKSKSGSPAQGDLLLRQ